MRRVPILMSGYKLGFVIRNSMWGKNTGLKFLYFRLEIKYMTAKVWNRKCYTNLTRA